MGRFVIVLKESAAKELQRLPKRDRLRSVAPIDALATDPFRSRPGVNIRKLRGTRSMFRLRVGDFRGIYEVQGEGVIFTRSGHRSKVYDPRPPTSRGAHQVIERMPIASKGRAPLGYLHQLGARSYRPLRPNCRSSSSKPNVRIVGRP